MQETRLELSQSFVMGHGGIEHNLRRCKGKSTRQNGIIERRHLNEVVVGADIKDVDATIKSVIQAEIGDRLDKLNERNIEKGHPERVKTLEQWIQTQCYDRAGKQRKVVQEYILQVGDRYTGCPYEMATDKQGHILDQNGRRIPAWDTRRQPGYKDGKITESERCRKLKKIYRHFVKAFIKENPRFRLLAAAIHADELGGCHIHINGIWINDTKNGVGIGLSKTSAMKQQYEEAGLKTEASKKKNAQNQWRQDMRNLLEDICKGYGIDRKDMHNTKKHDNITEYKLEQDQACEDIERRMELLRNKEQALIAKESELKAKEQELQADTIKEEWYILKHKYPEVYAEIQAECKDRKKKQKKFYKSVNKVLDKETNVLYNYR